MSEVKVNKLSPRSGTTVTLGDSGDTITVPSGVTFDASSGGLAGTLTTAAQPNITSVGTLTSFTSTGIDDNATSTAITIDNVERVGIGTATPSQLLEIYGTSPNVQWTYSVDGNNHRIFSFSDDFYIRADANNTGAGNLVFQNGGSSERMRINSSGSVGIGTSSPGTVPLNVVTTDGGNVDEILELRNNSTDAGTGVRLRLVTSTDAGSTPNSVSISSYRNASTDIDLLFETSSTERMRIDSSGNVGIGESSPLGKLHVKSADSGGTPNSQYDELVLEQNGNNCGMTILCNSPGDGAIYFGDSADNDIGGIAYSHFDNKMFFKVNASERMRIDSSGNVGIGTTSPSALLDLAGQFSDTVNTNLSIEMGDRWGFRVSTSLQDEDLHLDANLGGTPFTCMTWDKVNGNVKIGEGTGATFTVRVTPSAGSWGIDAGTDGSSFSRIRISSSGTGTQTKMAFFNTNGEVGSITTAGTSTSFNTSSDYRLKENVSYDFDATTRLKQLKPARFNFISDADTTVDGFLAHEVSSVVPEAISGEKDAVDDDGNPKYQGIDQAKLVPLLVKTIQELEARITTLENA